MRVPARYFQWYCVLLLFSVGADSVSKMTGNKNRPACQRLEARPEATEQ